LLSARPAVIWRPRYGVSLPFGQYQMILLGTELAESRYREWEWPGSLDISIASALFSVLWKILNFEDF